MVDIRPRRSRRGFTLAEVLLAAVILSFGLIAISRAMLKAYEGFSRAARVSQASRLLEERMESSMRTFADAPPDAAAAAAVEGRFDVPNDQYSWKLESRPSEVNDKLRILELKVLWEDRGREQSISAATYVEVEPSEKPAK